MIGPDAEIRVRCDDQWNFLQIYSPLDGDFACIEPMTGAVAALSDGDDHPVLPAGELMSASFELSVPEPGDGGGSAS